MTFLNGALLAGAAAGAIPIVIHLFHKSRFKVVKWGAMHLLEAVLRINQRRVKMEQWILLAIRTLIPILLALAMARPLWSGDRQLLGNARSSTVVLLDHSYSMGAARPGSTNWNTAREDALRLIGGLRNGSEVQVALMGQGGGALLDQPTVDLSRMAQVLARADATAGPANIPAALDLAAATLEKMHEPARQVVMITDFQRANFDPANDRRIAGALERMRKQPIPPSIIFWDAGATPTENVAVESLDFSKLVVGAGQKIQIRANLRNYGVKNHPDLRVTLKIDGQDKSVSQVMLGPQAQAQVLFTISFETAGSHVVEVATELDAIPADNTYLASIPVRDRLPVLLVDGASGARLDDMKSETAYLQIALSPFAAGKVEMSDLISASAIPADSLDAAALSNAQVAVLANVRQLTESQLRALEDFVKNGGGLLVFPGDQTDPAWWNGPFAALAPSPLGALAGDLKDSAPSVRVASQRFENAALELFNDPRNGTLSEAAIKRWYQLLPQDGTVLARLESGDPFLIEKPFGEGRVIACATAGDADWSNLPARPSFLPLAQRLCVYLASHVYPPRNLEIGQNLLSFLPAGTAGQKAVVTAPGSAPVEVPIVKKGERGVLEFGPITVPGLYTVTPPGGAPLHYVFNTNRQESDPARLSDAEVDALGKAHGVSIVRSAAEYRALEHRQRFGTELWKWVLWALLGFLFLELILQRRFARARRKTVPLPKAPAAAFAERRSP